MESRSVREWESFIPPSKHLSREKPCRGTAELRGHPVICEKVRHKSRDRRFYAGDGRLGACGPGFAAPRFRATEPPGPKSFQPMRFLILFLLALSSIPAFSQVPT